MANSIDIKVGKRITQRLDEGDVTREDVAFALGITIEELALIERGEKRADAETLKSLMGILDVPLSYFYKDLDDDNTIH